MNDNAAFVRELLDEYEVRYDSSDTFFSTTIILNDTFLRRKRRFVLMVDASMRNKIIVITQLPDSDSLRVYDEDAVLRNLNTINSKTVIGKFTLEGGRIKYKVSVEFNLLSTLFNSHNVKKKLLAQTLERLATFFDHNYDEFRNLPQYTETCPQFTFESEIR